MKKIIGQYKILFLFLSIILLSTSCKIIPVKATKGEWKLKQYFERAKEYQANQQYERATLLLVKASEFYKKPIEQIQILTKIGEYLEKQKKYKEALVTYKNIVTIFEKMKFEKDEERKQLLETTYIIPIKKKIGAIFEKYIIEAQTFSNNEKYKKALNVLNEAISQFPDTNMIAMDYNIGFIYYKLRKYDIATKYFNAAITLYNKDEFSYSSQGEEKKFIILSRKLLTIIDKKKEGNKDPYHIQEDLKNKIRPKLKTKKK